MSSFVSKLFRKSTFIALAVALLSVGVVSVATTMSQPQPVEADSCSTDHSDTGTDIIYGGLGTGNNADTLRQSLKKFYDRGYDVAGCHTDLQGIYNKVFASTGSGSLETILSSSDGWEMGYTNKDSSITDDSGKVLAHSAQIGSRCFTDGSNCQKNSNCSTGFSPFYGKYVDTHYPCTFFTRDGKPARTLIHVNQYGVVDFALWRDCGNFLLFIPQKQLFCAGLTMDLLASNPVPYTYTFTGSAAAFGGAKPTSYTFSYDTSSKFTSAKTIQTINSNALVVTTQPFTFTQMPTATTYYIKVAIANATSNANPSCQKSVQIPPKHTPTFACQAITLDTEVQNSTSMTINFTASTAGSESAKSYTFVFGDGTTADQSGNTVTHKYSFDASKINSFNGYFVATSTSGMKTDQNDKACQFTFSTQLVRTGPADTFGIVAGASIAGVALYQLILRRKLAL